MNQLIGQMIDRYQVLSLLGEGGMGAVLKARDVTLQRDVAIKVMHPQFAKDTNFQGRFLQEARTAAHLDHPGIVKIFDFGQYRSILYIVMEFIPGDNLRHLLANLKSTNKQVLLPEALHIIRQVGLALDYAHNHGVLHRDIKPDNIMLKPEPSDGLPYRPVITDLGLAKLAEGGIMTQANVSMGTPAYMSPEQAVGENTDPRSDVYSLGVLLYELVVGKLPFPARTLSEAIRYHVKEAPPPPRTIRPEIPQDVERLVLKAMEKKPEQRFPTAGAFAAALGSSISAVETSEQNKQQTAAATGLGTQVSLMTEYQKSVVEGRGASVLEEFPQAPPDLKQDRIQILDPDHTSRSINMKPGGLIIGRGNECDIMIDDSKVSRQHARIEFDGTRYTVIDLNSTNGTFLGTTRLLPGVAEVWAPDQPLRVGKVYLRQERAGQSQGTMAYTGTSPITGTVVDKERVYSSPGAGRVGVFLETAQLSATPGGNTLMKLVLLNQGTLVDHFKISINGIPADWTPMIPPPIQLMPGAQQEISLSIQPPKVSKSRAGRYPLVLQVASESAPDQAVEVKVTLTLTAYSQFTSDMHPQKVRAGQPARIMIENQGNTQETFTLALQDRGDELVFSPAQVRLAVPVGKEVGTDFRATPRTRRWFGAEKTHPFTAKVTSQDGQVRTHEGEVISRGQLPAWLIPLLLLLCLCIGASGALFGYYQFFLPPLRATETFRNDTTRVAQIVESTRQAGEATATWSAADDDKDGLTNSQELSLGTLPNKRDTDEDGLDDGDEVNNRGTDPLKADTDNDGIKDGEEIARGLNPKEPDTDGDGYPDAVDPDPLHLPTPTANLDATAAVVASQTAAAQAATSAAATAAAHATQAAANATQKAMATAQAATDTAATLTAAPPTAPPTPAPRNWNHAIRLIGHRSLYHLRLTGPGEIRIRASWSGTQDTLALIINGPGQVGYYARQDGPSTLEVAYTLTDADFQAGDEWQASVVSFGGGQADGIVDIFYPSGSAVVPFSDHFVITPSSVSSISLLVLSGPGAVNAQATWSGNPGSLALILNGPGQVGYYARQDGPSPLGLSYNVTAADLSTPGIWRITLISFSDADIEGTIDITYP